jgi:hypothetical protein
MDVIASVVTRTPYAASSATEIHSSSIAVSGEQTG